MDEWRKQLRSQGWVVLRGAVDSRAVDSANAVITSDLARNFDPSRQKEYDARSACPDQRGHPLIGGLYEAVSKPIDQLLGLRRVKAGEPQIAVRWTGRGGDRVVEPHLDGVRTEDNGVLGPLLSTYTALVGVFLTPCGQPWSGNFTVWPGSTQALSEYFRKRGRGALLEGMPEIELGEPVQLLVEPGDVVVCNYLLMHGCSPNLGDVQRRAVFFRLRRLGLAMHPYASLVDPWRDWL